MRRRCPWRLIGPSPPFLDRIPTWCGRRRPGPRARARRCAARAATGRSGKGWPRLGTAGGDRCSPPAPRRRRGGRRIEPVGIVVATALPGLDGDHHTLESRWEAALQQRERFPALEGRPFPPRPQERLLNPVLRFLERARASGSSARATRAGTAARAERTPGRRPRWRQQRWRRCRPLACAASDHPGPPTRTASLSEAPSGARTHRSGGAFDGVRGLGFMPMLTQRGRRTPRPRLSLWVS